MLLDEIPNRIVEIKRDADGDRSDRDPDEPVKNGGVLHKSIPNVTNSLSCRAKSRHPVTLRFSSAAGLKAWPRPDSFRGCGAASTSLGMAFMRCCDHIEIGTGKIHNIIFRLRSLSHSWDVDLAAD